MKLEDIETVMKLMKEHGVTALKFKDLELALPLVYAPAETEEAEAEMSEEDLMFYSAQ